MHAKIGGGGMRGQALKLECLIFRIAQDRRFVQIEIIEGNCNKMKDSLTSILTKKRIAFRYAALFFWIVAGFFLGRFLSYDNPRDSLGAAPDINGAKTSRVSLDGATYLAELKAPTGLVPYSELHKAKVAACVAEFEEKKNSFHYEGDIEARMREILAEGNTEMELQTNLEARLLFHQWLVKNPLELFQSLAQTDLYKLGHSVGYDVTMSHLRGLSENEVDQILQYSQHSLDSLGVHYFRKKIQGMENAEPDELINSLTKRLPSVQSDYWQAIVAELPPSMDVKLVDFIISQDNPIFLAQLRDLRSHHTDRTWLASFFHKHPELVEMMQRHPEALRNMGATSIAVSPASRTIASLDVMSMLALESPHSSLGAKIHELVRTESLNAMNMQKLLEEHAPTLATTIHGQDKALFVGLLLKTSPEYGFDFLASIPDSESKEQVLIEAVSDNEPETLFRVFSSYPIKPERGAIEERAAIWRSHSANYYRTFGDHYVTWLSGLPRGVDRDMAISALAETVKVIDPALSARLKDLK